MSDCAQFKEQYESYALGVLEGEERAALEAHLASACPVCVRAVAEARWLVAQLAYLAPDAQPPESLRRNLLGAVRVPEARRARAWFPIWAWVGSAALIAFAVFSLWQAHRMQNQLAELTARLKAGEAQRQKLAEERAIAERTNLILSDPASRLVTLQTKIGPQVHAFCHPKLGIILYGGSVPMPASNRTYQLWLVMKDKNAKPMSAAMFRPDDSGKVMLMVPAMPADMDSTAALAISEEPSGGSPQPTSAPIWVGALT